MYLRYAGSLYNVNSVKCGVRSTLCGNFRNCGITFYLVRCGTVQGFCNGLQAYRNDTMKKMTRGSTSFIFDPRDMLLTYQIVFSFFRPEVACSILERISGLEPSSETTAPNYFNLVTVPSCCTFTFISLWMPLALFDISLVFSAPISILYLV